MASKRRIFQVAKEFNISNEALLAFLSKLEYPVKNHMSPISEDMYEDVVKKYHRQPGKESASSDSEYDFRKKLREKKAEEQKRKEKAREEMDQRIKLAREVVVKPKRRKEPSKEEVLKIAKATAKAEAHAQIKEGTYKKEVSEEFKEHQELETAETEQAKEQQPVQSKDKTQDKKKPKKAKDKSGRTKEELSDQSEDGVEIFEESTDETTGSVDLDDELEKKDKKKRKTDKAPKAKSTDKNEEKDDPSKGKKKRKRKKKKRQISEEEISASIKQTLAAMGDSSRGKRRRRKVKDDGEEVETTEVNVIKVSEFISASDLASLMDVDPSEVIKKSLELGIMVSINQRLDMDTIVMIADEFDFEVEQEKEFAEILEDDDEVVDADEDLEPRPPVVTIMGHVDHGKTSLLDYIRTSNIIAGEAGGITQHIGAYEVTLENGKQIAFLDTPGHEAFTAMRARGAQATDIVILVVAADDGVQEQTIEALNHAKAAGVPIVVAINKIDRPSANPETIKQQLSQHGVLLESWGGKYQSAEISAKTGHNIETLMDAVLLEAELLELKANPNRPARGLIVESELDRGKGAIATVLVQAGTLRVGDIFVSGLTFGRVRAMLDERDRRVKEAPPSTPVRVIGFSSVPQAGDKLIQMENEKDAREISMKRQQLRREQEIRQVKHQTLDQISKQIRDGRVRELNIIVKGDVDGSVEAIADSLMKLSTNEVAVNVIHKGVGGITESDVNLATASDAVILGFHVRVSLQARDLAAKEEIDIRLYRVIYDAVNDVKAALEGMLEPEMKEEVSGTIEIRETFKVPKIGTIAGCYVMSGKIRRNDPVRLYRDNKLIYDGKIASLRRFKDDTKEVATGFECGVGIEGYDDLRVGDIIECIEVHEIKRTL